MSASEGEADAPKQAKVSFEEMWDTAQAEAWRQACSNGARALIGETVSPSAERRVRVMEATCVLLELIMANEREFRVWLGRARTAGRK